VAEKGSAGSLCLTGYSLQPELSAVSDREETAGMTSAAEGIVGGQATRPKTVQIARGGPGEDHRSLAPTARDQTVPELAL